MAITLPQVRIFQDYLETAPPQAVQLPAFLAGGLAHLQRYEQSAEKEDSLLGRYDHVGTTIDGEQKTCYSWPGRPAGAVLDPSYTRVYVENALLRYLQDNSEAAVHIAANKISHPTLNFKENPIDPGNFPRDGSLGDRDVQVGDLVAITASTSAGLDDVEISTYVQAVEATDQPAVVGSSSANSGNQATQSAGTNNTADGGNSGSATIDAVSGTSYDGHADGVLSETYTITVIQSSVGGDATTAKLQVLSASGLDDVLELTPEDFGDPTPIGARGATVTWDGGSTEFVQGDSWTVEIEQAFTAPTTASSGTYDDTKDRVYEITVVKGGAIATAEIQARALNGSDFSGPTVVGSSGSAVAVGTKGVMIAFTATHLCRGDRYYITATGRKPGDYNILVLGHDLDVLAQSLGTTLVELRLSLYLRDTIELPAQSAVTPGQWNWQQTDTEVCLMAGIQVYHPQWTANGQLVALPLVDDSRIANANSAYVTYRAWRTDLVGDVLALSDPSALNEALPGPLSPDNPLKYGLFCALENNNGQPVRYSVVGDPNNIDNWIAVLDRITGRNDVYGLVPLTTDSQVLNLFQAHVDSQSNETRNRWRALWVNLQAAEDIQLVGEEASGETVEAVLEDDPNTTGIQYTLLRVVSGNASLLTAGVKPGDTIRYQYTADAWGGESYSQYTVDAVLSDTTLRLTPGSASEENVAMRVEIWHRRTPSELVQEIIRQCGTWNNRRVRCVWPESLIKDGQEVPGYFLCAALAAYASGVAPQQGLTNATISGFSATPKSTQFSETQLADMTEGGCWVVNQAPTGEIYTVWAVTSAEHNDLNAREEMIVRNYDSISYFQARSFESMIGRVNAVPGTVEIIDATLKANIQALRQSFYQEDLGGQIIDGEVQDVRVSPVFKDRIIARVRYEIGYPMNFLDLYQLI